MVTGNVGPAPGASQTVGGSTLPASPSPRSIFTKTSGGNEGLYVSVTSGAWVGPLGTGSGSVTSVSVVSANGFAGTVATATTTPAITLSTTITGILKGNATAISAATAGADYVVPGTTNNNATRISALGLNISAGSAGTLKFGAGGAAITTLQGSGGAAAWTMTLPVGAGSSGQYLQTDGAGVTSWQTVSAGVTNSAGANVIPKSNGTNLVASLLTDDGTDLTSSANNFALTSNHLVFTGSDGGTSSISQGATSLEVSGVDGNNRIIASMGSNFIVIEGVTNTITNTAANSFDVNSVDAVFTLGGNLTVGSDGDKLRISTAGQISKYNGAFPTDGQVLIGKTSDGTLNAATITAGTGISITNGAGSITILQDGTSPKKASIALTSQSASIGATNIQVDGGVAPAGLYRLSYYLVTTTAGTSGTVSATFSWSDIAAARTSGTGNITFGTLASPAAGTVIIQANGVANITYLTTVTAAVGSPVYALNVTLEKLQ